MSIDIESMYPVKDLQRPCPICNSLKGHAVHSQSFLLPKGSPLPKSYVVVSCTRCQFVFADMQATQKDYDAYYSLSSRYENEEFSSGAGLNRWDFQRLTNVANEIEKHIPSKESRICDIGSGLGGLLRVFSTRGFGKLYAIEPSQSCVEKIKFLSKGNIEAFSSNLHSDLHDIAGKEKFDVIILSHVLEHLYDINTAIINLKKILSDDGVVYVEVPDSANYQNHSTAPYYYFDSEHINHFNKSTLISIFGVNGFSSISADERIVEVSDSKYYPVVFSLFKKNKSLKFISDYVKICSNEDNSKLFMKLKESQEPVAIWGCGSHTERQLGTTDLRNCNISYIVDIDTKKQGRSIGSFIVSAPDVLHRFDGRILISSPLHHDSIVRSIRSMGLRNEILILR